MLVTDNLWRQLPNLNSRDPQRAETPDSKLTVSIGISSPGKKQGSHFQRCHRRFCRPHAHLISTLTHLFRSPRAFRTLSPMCNTLPSFVAVACVPPPRTSFPSAIRRRLCKGWDGVIVREPSAATICPAV